MPTLIYLLSVVLIAPAGNFLVNDDWIFVRQIEAFQKNIWALSSLIDPSFILQGLLGYLWTQFFGLSFDTLRLLSIVLHAMSGVVLYRIAKKLDISSGVSTVLTFVFLFNPILYTSSMSFMTETYYMFFYLLAVFYLVQYAKDLKQQHLFLGLFFSCCSFLIREFALTLFVGYVFLIWKNFKHLKTSIFVYRWLVGHILVFLVMLGVYLFWPKAGQTDTMLPSFFTDKIWMLIFTPVYFVAFSYPLLCTKLIKRGLLSETSRLSLHYKILFITSLVIAFALIVFKFDIFPVGNVLYVEGLYAKSNFKTNLSIFDNSVFKISYAIFIAYFFVVTLYTLKSVGYRLSGNTVLQLLALLGGSSVLILFLAPDFYERYLVSAWVPFVLLIASCIQVNDLLVRSNIFMLVIYCLFSFVLQYEFVVQSKIKMLHASQLKATLGVEESVSLSGNYTKYVSARGLNDFVGNKNLPQISYSCYIQQYTQDTDSLALAVLTGTENFAEKFVDNPKIYLSTKNDKIPRIKKNLDKLLLNTTYFSPMYSLIGKEAYVGSWCN